MSLLAKIILISAVLSSPAFADGVTGQFVPDPGRPGWKPSPSDIVYQENSDQSNQLHRNWDVGRTADGTPVVVYGGAGTDRYGRARIYDEPIGGSTVIIRPGNPNPIPVDPERPLEPPVKPVIPVVPVNPGDPVPGPLGVAGAVAAFTYSRKLRNRMRFYDTKNKASGNT